jgi:predicted Fe-S protein YdhL (DUF1289 family)
VCSTGIGDACAVAASAIAHEVIHWNGYSEEQKRIVDGRLAQFLAAVRAEQMRVTDVGAAGLAARDAADPPQPGPRPATAGCSRCSRPGQGRSTIRRLRLRGDLRVALPAPGPGDLREQIDAEYYALSCAHFERYHVVPTCFPRETAL